ncbi:iron-containing alcohol dehydrogenase, partial [candidate division FCPU426 bacterium]|nr:iron-containing alcohol dehydrogenase [candidate division FCPU426 bacterium]
GGSAVDAAKAMAVLLANKALDAKHLPEASYDTPALPIAAVPTTAGTGTEVTPYAVLTDKAGQTKRAFSTHHTFPHAAWVDPRYTHDLPWPITRDTALDAFSHLAEGYLSRKSNPCSDRLAEAGFGVFQNCVQALLTRTLTPLVREQLMLASLLGGMVIAMAGTATVHALGYPLTYFKGLPHGRANGYLLASQLQRSAAVTEKVGHMLACLCFTRLEELTGFISAILPPPPALNEEECRIFAAKAAGSKNHAHNPYPVDEEMLCQMLKESLPAEPEKLS